MTLQQMKYAIEIAEKGSMNEAAKSLFVSQPSLSETIRELEAEIGVTLFLRSNRGITVTSEGSEFLGYARQTIEQYQLMERRYLEKDVVKPHFHVSTQHYSFAVNAFAELLKEVGMDSYEFAIYEERTYEVIMDVRDFRSDIGVLYLDDFNRDILRKMFRDHNLEFYQLFCCHVFAYLPEKHPLASKDRLTMDDLDPYPCLSFDQGMNNSFYFSEEVLSTYDYRKLIKSNDRATNLNLMKALNGYTLCSGILCEDLNGSEFVAIPLDTETIMEIGYVIRKNSGHNPLREQYIELLRAQNTHVL